jgi:hypothetical protein
MMIDKDVINKLILHFNNGRFDTIVDGIDHGDLIQILEEVLTHRDTLEQIEELSKPMV